METKHNLTAVEMAHLWNGYTFESIVHHIILCFINHSEDEEIKTLCEYCANVSRDHIDDFTSIFHKENFPIPRGVTSEDINPNTPRLFSDKFMALYINLNYS